MALNWNPDGAMAITDFASFLENDALRKLPTIIPMVLFIGFLFFLVHIYEGVLDENNRHFRLFNLVKSKL